MGEEKHHGFCHRCEWRAQFLENGRRPRLQCGDKGAINSCYMYQPVRPNLMVRDTDDPRPQFGPAMLSSRSRCGGPAEDFVPDLYLMALGGVLFWRPKCDGVRYRLGLLRRRVRYNAIAWFSRAWWRSYYTVRGWFGMDKDDWDE